MVRVLVSSSLLCVAMLACGEGSDSPDRTATPASAPNPGSASLQQISAEAMQCLDLVKQERYVEAIDPCGRAVQDSANADVKRAYDEAMAVVQKEAEAAAIKAAAGSLSGKPADEAAGSAARDALRKFGGQAP